MRVLLADDQMLFRDGLSRVIADWDDCELVGCAADGAEAVDLYAKLRPDVVLMDLRMPVMDGAQATAAIVDADPDAVVVILTMSEEEDGLLAAIGAGARGYLLKDTPTRRLHDQLRGAVAGKVPISGKVAAIMAEEYARRGSASPDASAPSADPDEAIVRHHLTEREVDVLRLLAAGLSNQEIAAELVISEKTVKKHLNAVFAKIDAANRVQAATFALRSGIA